MRERRERSRCILLFIDGYGSCFSLFGGDVHVNRSRFLPLHRSLSLSPFVGLPFLRCHKWKRARAKAESISVHCARPYQITTEKYKSVSELCLIHIDSEVIYFAKLELRYEKLACAAAAAAVAVAVAVRFEDTHITLRIDLAYKIWTVLVLAETHKCSRRRNLSLAISQQWNLYLQMWIVYLILLLLLFYYYCCI